MANNGKNNYDTSIQNIGGKLETLEAYTARHIAGIPNEMRAEFVKAIYESYNAQANKIEQQKNYINQQTRNVVNRALQQQKEYKDNVERMEAARLWQKAGDDGNKMFENSKLEEQKNLLQAESIVSPPNAKIDPAVVRQIQYDRELKDNLQMEAERQMKAKEFNITNPLVKNAITNRVNELLRQAKAEQMIQEWKQKQGKITPENTTSLDTSKIDQQLQEQKRNAIQQNTTQGQQVSQQKTQQNHNTTAEAMLFNALQRRNELARQHYAQELARQKANHQRQQMTKLQPQQSLTYAQLNASLNGNTSKNPYADILKQNFTQKPSQSNNITSISTQSQTSLYPNLNNQDFSNTQFKPTLSSKTEMRPSTVLPTNKGGFGYPSL